MFDPMGRKRPGPGGRGHLGCGGKGPGNGGTHFGCSEKRPDGGEHPCGEKKEHCGAKEDNKEKKKEEKREEKKEERKVEKGCGSRPGSHQQPCGKDGGACRKITPCCNNDRNDINISCPDLLRWALWSSGFFRCNGSCEKSGWQRRRGGGGFC